MGMEWGCQEMELMKMDKADNNVNINDRNECCLLGCEGSCVKVKVMTDEQLEVLRKQISVYTSICERLVQMHKAATAQQDVVGMAMGNMDYDPLLASVKMTPRQRWTPTATQLQILEHIFIQGNGTPTKPRIKEITSELTRYGQVSEANVYNWFQNRRARLKRKQLCPASATSEKETGTEVDSPKDKKKISMNFLLQDDLEQMDGNIQLDNAETREEACGIDATHKKEESFFTLDCHLRSSASMSEIGIDQWISKLDTPLSFNPYGYSPEFDLIE